MKRVGVVVRTSDQGCHMNVILIPSSQELYSSRGIKYYDMKIRTTKFTGTEVINGRGFLFLFDNI